MNIQTGINKKASYRKITKGQPQKNQETSQPTDGFKPSNPEQEQVHMQPRKEAKPAKSGVNWGKVGVGVAGATALGALALPGAAMAAEAGGEAAGAAGAAALEQVAASNSGGIPGWVFPAVMGVAAVGSLYFMYKNYKLNQGQMMGGAGRGRATGTGKHKFDWVESVDKGFDDVAGIKEAKRELMEMVQFLKNPDRFTKLGAKMPRGALLEGPPGTGKTLLAEAVAGEAGLPFVKVTGSEFVEKYVGVGASRVRELFAQARDKARGINGGKYGTYDKNGSRNDGAIIFIDEIDAIGQQRTGEGNSAERESTLNQILTEMSGFKNDDNILVIAATNRAELLDSALTRSGRFDRKITVDSPSREGREAILKIHAKNKPLAEGVSLADVAARTPGLVGADMAAIMNEASIYAARDGVDAIEMKHLSRAIDKVIMGEQRSGTLLSQKERISTAYHEGGHAIIARALPANGDLHKVTILPRGKALGVTWTANEEDKHGYTTEDLEDKICMLMGGRAAEEVVFGEVTTGASNDIERATQLANRMVNEFAMDDEVGTINLASPKKTGYQPSGELAGIASKAVKDILDTQYARAKDILAANRDALNDLSEGMLDYEELDRSSIEDILGDRVPVLRKELDLEQFRPEDKQGEGPKTEPMPNPAPEPKAKLAAGSK